MWWCLVPCKKAAIAERYAQWLLREAHVRGEWFDVTTDAAIDTATGIGQINELYPCPWQYHCYFDNFTRYAEMLPAWLRVAPYVDVKTEEVNGLVRQI